jgi:hypothetical protein
VRPSGLGPFREFFTRIGGYANWTTDGRGTPRGTGFSGELSLQLSGYHYVGCEAGYDHQTLDVREIEEAGVPFQRKPGAWLVCWLDTDQSRAISGGGFVAQGLHLAQGRSPTEYGWGGELYATLRPHPRLETRLAVGADYTPDGPRYYDTLDDGTYRFGNLHSQFVSLTLRQQLVITPTLTLQAYAQLFSAYGSYFPFYRASSPGKAPILEANLIPTGEPEERYHTASLNVNLVARWEYRLGSTLFAVYTHAQEEPELADGEIAPATLLPALLGKGPSTDVFMIKWSYWWDV